VLPTSDYKKTADIYLHFPKFFLNLETSTSLLVVVLFHKTKVFLRAFIDRFVIKIYKSCLLILKLVNEEV
jgi:hypothetical protein